MPGIPGTRATSTNLSLLAFKTFPEGFILILQVFFCFAVVTNLLVSTSMLQGCVAVVNALTGVNIYGAFLCHAIYTD